MSIETTTSFNILTLIFSDAPKCIESNKTSIGANIGSNLTVLCSVDSFPKPSNFTWSFNNSKDSFKVPSDKFTVNGTSSTVKHSLLSDHNFGQLVCWARNSKGVMRDPCVFNIIPARPPSAPVDCMVLNQTTDLLQVECQPGFDGGLDQRFLLEVVDVANTIILANVSSSRPHFTITGLNPGREHPSLLKNSPLKLLIFKQVRMIKSTI